MAKAPIQAIADRISAVFVPIVVLLALAVWLAWFLTGTVAYSCTLFNTLDLSGAVSLRPCISFVQQIGSCADNLIVLLSPIDKPCRIAYKCSSGLIVISYSFIAGFGISLPMFWFLVQPSTMSSRRTGFQRGALHFCTRCSMLPRCWWLHALVL